MLRGHIGNPDRSDYGKVYFMAKKSSRKDNHISAIGKPEERGRRFTKISIKNFRCLKDFRIDSLEMVNLIGGKNNVGKTTLLEILFLLLGASNIGLLLKINAFRGMDTYEGEASSIRESLWSHLFHNFDSRANITIDGYLEVGGKIAVALKQLDRVPTVLPLGSPSQGRTDAGTSGALAQALQLDYADRGNRIHSVILHVGSKGIELPPPSIEPLFPGMFLAGRRRQNLKENATRYGQLELTKSHHEILPVLQLIEPRLKQLSTIVVSGVPILHGDIGLARMLPMAVMGDGLNDLVSILLAISCAPGGVVLVDEIENGLHYSIMMTVWQVIAEAARRNNTQIFATTHSWECIEAAHKAFLTNETYDFRYHRLERIDDNIEAVALGKDELQTTIEKGWEIR